MSEWAPYAVRLWVIAGMWFVGILACIPLCFWIERRWGGDDRGRH